jgi:hypothetical protein
MQIFAAIAIVVFVLGLFFGLPYQQAYKRRQALGLDKETDSKPDRPAPLEKPAARV